MVVNILAPTGSVPQDSDRRGHRSYNQTDLDAGNHSVGLDNHDTDPDYVSAPYKQRLDLAAECR